MVEEGGNEGPNKKFTQVAKDSWFWHKFTKYQTYSNAFSSNVEHVLASNIHTYSYSFTTNGAGLAHDL